MIEFYAPETMIDERIREVERKAAQSGGGRCKRMPSAMTHSAANTSSQFSKNK
jgi:hypothetical protein